MDMIPIALAFALTADQQLARDILEQLIALDTTHSTGDTTAAARAMAQRFQDAGFASSDMEIAGPTPNRGNLVVRMKGTGAKKPLLLLAHFDVVEARREDWTMDPFRLNEKDGYLYGRGTGDDKGQAAIWVATLIRMKREGFRPDRDLIVALTADEESGGEHNGVEWLLKNRRELIDAEFALNEGGMGQLKSGQKLLNQVQVSEKAAITFVLDIRNKGGHSSMPTKDNAIYRLARAIQRLEEYEFPVTLNEVTRAYFAKMAAIETGQTAKDMAAVAKDPPDPEAARRLAASPYYNALLRTTCVATRLEGGHADNALPQLARVTVNCRMLPGETPQSTEATLMRVLRDKDIVVIKRSDPKLSKASALDAKVFGPIEAVTRQVWPGVPVVPVMLTGGTDGRDLRNYGIPTYGICGIFYDMDDVRWHGRDERIGVKEFYEAQEFLYRLVKAYAH